MDLSQCTLLTKQDQKVDLALCNRRSTERCNMQQTGEIKCLDLQKLFSRLQGDKIEPSVKTGFIPKSITEIVGNPGTLMRSLVVEYVAEGESSIVDIVRKRKKQRRRK